MLEIGAGQGSVGVLLARRYAYVGLEPDASSFAVAVRRITRGQVVCSDDRSYEPDQPFDLVCAFEVLEHLEDDRGALERWQRFVRPGGWVLVSVPQGRRRMGAADRRAGHLRRYDRADLEDVLARAGLTEIAVVAYGFPLGNALELGRNVLASRSPGTGSERERTSASGRWLQPPDAAARATHLFALPFRLLQRPFAGTSLGTGLVARARRADYTTTAPRRKSTMLEVGAPGVKISATPSALSSFASAPGIVPPTTTRTSSAPFSRSPSRIRGTSVMWAPERMEMPTASASSWIAVSTICSGVWCRPV